MYPHTCLMCHFILSLSTLADFKNPALQHFLSIYLASLPSKNLLYLTLSGPYIFVTFNKVTTFANFIHNVVFLFVCTNPNIILSIPPPPRSRGRWGVVFPEHSSSFPSAPLARWKPWLPVLSLRGAIASNKCDGRWGMWTDQRIVSYDQSAFCVSLALFYAPKFIAVLYQGPLFTLARKQNSFISRCCRNRAGWQIGLEQTHLF